MRYLNLLDFVLQYLQEEPRIQNGDYGCDVKVQLRSVLSNQQHRYEFTAAVRVLHSILNREKHMKTYKNVYWAICAGNQLDGFSAEQRSPLRC